MVGRALLATAIAGMTLHHAAAQFGGMPGLPDGPPSAGFGVPQTPPPQCQALLAIRDELQKRGQAIEAANQKKADVRVACRRFRTYLATEAKMLGMLEDDGASCGVSPDVIRQVRSSHAKAREIGHRVCVAANRFVPAPTLDDALGISTPPPSEDQKPFLYDGLWPPNRRP